MKKHTLDDMINQAYSNAAHYRMRAESLEAQAAELKRVAARWDEQRIKLESQDTEDNTD